MSTAPKHSDIGETESGILWLGTVPPHWLLTKLKFLTTFQVGWTPPTKQSEYFEGENLWANISDLQSRVINDTQKRISDEAIGATRMKLIPRGSLLYSFKLSVGLVAFAGVEMYTNEAIASFVPASNICLDYLYYALPFFVEKNAATNIYGARILNHELINNARVLAPPLEEQTQIAKFLDYETAKIDALIEKQQQLIALLKEKRQAVISHAVTKGLNPDAPMRDSGIEWLGEVPAHWSVLKGAWLGQLFGSESISEDQIGDEGGLLFIKVSSLSLTDFNLAERRYFVSTTHSRRVTPRTDFIVFPKRGAAIFTNKVNIVREPAVLDPNLMGWLPNERIKPEFLSHVLKLRGLEDIADISTVPQINNKHLTPMKFAVPPIDEQEEILGHLLPRLETLKELLTSSETQIELLQERRTSLISAAVTGKIDVRNWSPPEHS